MAARPSNQLRPGRAATVTQTHTLCTRGVSNGGTYLNCWWRLISTTTTTGAYWKLMTSIENCAHTSNYEPILCQYAPAATTKPSSGNDDDRRDGKHYRRISGAHTHTQCLNGGWGAELWYRLHRIRQYGYYTGTLKTLRQTYVSRTTDPWVGRPGCAHAA